MAKIVYDPTNERKGKAHHEDTAKADKKVNISEKAHEALEKKAKAKGKTVKEKVAEIVEQKTSPFPAEGRINDYGFLNFKAKWLENLGWTKGMALKIEKNADGSITLRKA